MNNYYRFINCKYEDYRIRIGQQDENDQLIVKIIDDSDSYEDTDSNIITIVLRNGVIIDIYRRGDINE